MSEKFNDLIEKKIIKYSNIESGRLYIWYKKLQEIKNQMEYPKNSGQPLKFSDSSHFFIILDNLENMRKELRSRKKTLSFFEKKIIREKFLNLKTTTYKEI
jgi:hypothetical protein